MGLSASDSGDPNDMTVTEAFDIPPFHVAAVELDAASYSPGQDAIATVNDTGLNVSSVNVTFTTSRGDSESVVLDDVSGGNSSEFRGAAKTTLHAGAVTANNGQLEIYFGDTITVTYTDPDDGSGDVVDVFETASVGTALSTQRIGPDGAGMRSSDVQGQLSPGVTDVFRVDVVEGETVSIAVDPSANVRPAVEFRRDGETVIASQWAGAAGESVLLQHIAIETGTYDLLVSDQHVVGGSYNLVVATNGGLEAETFGGSNNSDLVDAQVLTFRPLSIGTGEISTVHGRGSNGADVDSYRIDLIDGQSTSVGLTGPGSVIELLDEGGAIVASGAPANNLDQAISTFTDSTVNGEVDSYFLRVLNPASDYQLVVTRDAVLDVEPNNTSETAQQLDGVSAAVGHLASADADYFEIPALAGAPVTVTTGTPGDQLRGELTNQLNPQLRLLDDDGNELTFDTTSLDGKNAQLTYVSPSDATLFVEVSAQTGMGDYQLLVDRSLVPALVVDVGDGLVVGEDGTSDSFTVALTRQPNTNVVLDVSSNSSHLSASQRLTFTPSDWNAPQAVSLNAIDNLIVDGARTGSVTISVDAGASDEDYDSVSSQVLSVTVQDDELAELIVHETDSATIVYESGLTDAIDVALSAEPISDVVVILAPEDGTEVIVSPATLTFTPANWNVAQTVTILGADDDAADGDVTTSLLVSVDTGPSDNLFGDAAGQTIDVTTRDDEDDPVEVSLTLRELDESPGIRVGEDFEVDVSFADRVNVQALMSAYVDVTFSASHLAISGVSYDDEYTDLQTGVLDSEAGVIADLGATAADGIPTGNRVVTLQMQALEIGSTDVSTSIASAIESAVLLFDTEIQGDQRFDTIHDSLTVEILPNAAVSLVIDDSLDGVEGIDPGETFHVDVHIRDLANGLPVRSGYVDVVFDPTYFEVTSIVFDEDYQDGRTGLIDNDSGRVDELGAFTLGGAPANDRIATLEFLALQSGTTVIGTELADAVGSPLLSFSGNLIGDLRGQADYGDVSLKVGRADLETQVFLINSAHLLQGRANLTYFVHNSGSGPAESFQNHLIWSPNDILGDGDDVVIPDSESTISGLGPGASRSVTLALQLDRAMLYAHSRSFDPPGSGSGTASNDVSHLFLVVDANNSVEEIDESNNTNGEVGKGVLPVTYFPWDSGGDGIVTPLDALQTLQAVNTSDLISDFDGNGVVTPLEALGIIQRIGYRRSDAVASFAGLQQSPHRDFAATVERPVSSFSGISAEIPRRLSVFDRDESEDVRFVPRVAAQQSVKSDTDGIAVSESNWLDLI